MTVKNLLKAPLRPNKKAAGVKVGAKTETVKTLWGEPVESEQAGSTLVRWLYGEVWFWIKNGRVHQIAVYAGYEGRTREGIGIGSTRMEVEDAYGPLSWDGCWLVNRPPFGIGFDFNDVPEINRLVSGIYIFQE